MASEMEDYFKDLHIPKTPPRDLSSTVTAVSITSE